MAAALSLTFGRGGALLGNLLFGYLIDFNCAVPIVLFSAMLFSKFVHFPTRRSHIHTKLQKCCFSFCVFFSKWPLVFPIAEYRWTSLRLEFQCVSLSSSFFFVNE